MMRFLHLEQFIRMRAKKALSRCKTYIMIGPVVIHNTADRIVEHCVFKSSCSENQCLTYNGDKQSSPHCVNYVARYLAHITSR